MYVVCIYIFALRGRLLHRLSYESLLPIVELPWELYVQSNEQIALAPAAPARHTLSTHCDHLAAEGHVALYYLHLVSIQVLYRLAEAHQ